MKPGRYGTVLAMTVLLTDGGTLSAVKQAAVANVAGTASVSDSSASVVLPPQPSRWAARVSARMEAATLRVGSIGWAGLPATDGGCDLGLLEEPDREQERECVGEDAQKPGDRGQH